MATRVLMIKADGSVLVHSDGGSYKPLNWMSPPCKLREGTTDEGQVEWVVTGKDRRHPADPASRRSQHDSSHELGVDPGLQKDGVEKHLQELLAEHPATLAEGLTLVRREYPTAIGPVDLMCRDAAGASRGRRDQAPRRHRRRRAADPLPRAAQPRPAAGPGPRHLRRAGDQAAGPGARHRPRHRLCRSSTTTPSAASTTPATGCSDHADLPHRHRGRLGGRAALRRVHDLDPRPHPRAGGLHPRLPAGPGRRRLAGVLRRRGRAAGAARRSTPSG